MNFFILKSIKCHMFSSFKDMSAVMFEDMIKVIDSIDGGQLFLCFHFLLKTNFDLKYIDLLL